MGAALVSIALLAASAQAGTAGTVKPKPKKPAATAPKTTPPATPPATPPKAPPRPSLGALAKARYAAAAAKYAAGDYAGAAAGFRQAYGLVKDPAFLFDVAQAYRLASDCGSALPFYRAFLSSTKPNATHRTEAAGGVRACSASATAAIPMTTAPVETTTRVVHAHHGSSATRITGLTTAGAGVLAAAAAAYFGWRAHDASTDIQGTLSRNGGVWTDSLQAREDQAQHDDAKAIGLSVGGAAAMLAGSLLFYLGRDRGSEVVVEPHGDGAVVGWTSRF
jgi:hypothetical protein